MSSILPTIEVHSLEAVSGGAAPNVGEPHPCYNEIIATRGDNSLYNSLALQACQSSPMGPKDMDQFIKHGGEAGTSSFGLPAKK